MFKGSAHHKPHTNQYILQMKKEKYSTGKLEKLNLLLELWKYRMNKHRIILKKRNTRYFRNSV